MAPEKSQPNNEGLATPDLLTNYDDTATRTYKFATVSGKTVTITDQLTH